MLPGYYYNIVTSPVLFWQVVDYGWKTIINLLGMVTTHKMHRNKMGNHVTKSNLLHNSLSWNKSYFRYGYVHARNRFSSSIVKAQRSDGSRLLKNNLRCGLLVYENNYITKILSNRYLTNWTFSINPNSDQSNNYDINWTITGLTDAEGAFMIKIRKLSSLRTGWAIEPSFEIALHLKDLDLLNKIRDYFENIGTITINNNKNICVFSVRSLKDIISKIIPHFDIYLLITKKRADYLLFKQVILMMQDKEHLKKEGVEKIINIRATMNLGLSSALKEAFPLNVPVLRPIVDNKFIINPNWMSGFSSGEGCFSISLIYNKDNNITYVQLRFSISQHNRDKELMNSFISYFNCGYITESRRAITYYVVKFSDIYEKIIPFFHQNNILGVKSKDFNDWCKVAGLIKQSKHLNKEGLDEIIKIKNGMNQNRPNE